MSVSKEDAKRRLNYLRAQMLRAIFGNSWRRKGGKIVFLIFKQGSRVPEYGPQHLRAKVVQTAFRVLLRELVSPMAPRGRESSMDWISIAILNSDQLCSPSIAIRT